MSVKRYEVNGSSSVFEDENGSLVDYEDYAALEQRLIESGRYGRQTDITIDNLEMKLAQMAVELNAVEAIHTEAVFITDDHYEQCPPQVQKMIRTLAVLQIPAYQAFLAELRAQGADECVRQLVTSDDDGFSDAPNICAMVAHQLRKGVQS